jgi:hypothetical protein
LKSTLKIIKKQKIVCPWANDFLFYDYMCGFTQMLANLLEKQQGLFAFLPIKK